MFVLWARPVCESVVYIVHWPHQSFVKLSVAALLSQPLPAQMVQGSPLSAAQCLGGYNGILQLCLLVQGIPMGRSVGQDLVYIPSGRLSTASTHLAFLAESLLMGVFLPAPLVLDMCTGSCRPTSLRLR